MKLSTRCAHQIHYPNQERRSSVGDESAPDCDKCRLNKLTKKKGPFKGFGKNTVSIPHNWVSSLCVCVSSDIAFCTFTSQLLCESIIVSDEIWSLSTCHQQMVNTRPTSFYISDIDTMLLCNSSSFGTTDTSKLFKLGS